jgi:hypothetical protein
MIEEKVKVVLRRTMCDYIGKEVRSFGKWVVCQFEYYEATDGPKRVQVVRINNKTQEWVLFTPSRKGIGGVKLFKAIGTPYLNLKK